MSRLFGLRLSRIQEFKAVLESEGRANGWTEVCDKIIDAVLVLIFTPSPTKQTIHNRYRICLNCPICAREWNSKKKRFIGPAQCRVISPDGGKLGCGCYLPYKVLSPGPCWGERIGIGW